MSHATRQRESGGVVSKYRARIHDLEPILQQDGIFRFGDVRSNTLSDNQLRTLLTELKDDGCLTAVKERTGGSFRSRYEWNKNAKEALKNYRKQLDTLPCNHRKHIPDGRGAPEGKLQCKYCDELYTKDEIRELVCE